MCNGYELRLHRCNVLAMMPSWIGYIFGGSGIVPAAIVAIILNIVLKKDPVKGVSKINNRAIVEMNALRLMEGVYFAYSWYTSQLESLPGRTLSRTTAPVYMAPSVTWGLRARPVA